MATRGRRVSFPLSDHCDGERFFNPHGHADRSAAEVVRWMRTRRPTPWPARAPLVRHDPPPGRVDPGHVALTFIGHSTFLIRTARAAILTDPVFTSRAGPFGTFGPRRVRPPAIGAERLPRIDLVLLSHNHYDHLQPSSLSLFRPRAVFAVPLGLGSFASGSRGILELDWWESASADAIEITCVPAQHFSARTPWDRNRTLWCGFVVRVEGMTLYFAGDSGYSPQFAEIGARFPSIDVSLLPIGAYEPRWFMRPAHVNPEEAVRAHLDLKSRLSIAAHFGTFPLTDEGIDEPLRALERARNALAVPPEHFRVLDFGETLVV
jgi:L-ascorbate metabolism protein UlaG (beta-lactamase superfamily)